ncbi:MAG: sulfatase [Verrucomicrobiota bacterium]
MKRQWVMGVAAFAVLMMGSVAAPKNFIIIFTDDQGYGDLGCFGSPRVPTPNIDQMAKEGLKLTSFYTASSVCSPSRAALLTGRMPKRAGVPKVLFPRSQDGLPADEITIAELLKQKDYATALVGKWHLGHKKPYLPTNQGFDSYFGVPYSNDMSIAKELAIAPDIQFNSGWTRQRLESDWVQYQKDYKSMKDYVPLMRDEEVIEYPADQAHLTQRYTEEAVKFIKENREQPFFLYMAHTMPHTPFFVSEDFTDKTGHGLYCDSLAEIDWSVGQVIDAVKSNGLTDDTLILYTSDNGPAKGSRPSGSHSSDQSPSAGPLRGYKFETFEGGQRVGTVAWSPGMIAAGQESDEMASTLDLFPTLAGLAGAELPDGHVLDGYSLVDFLSGESAVSPRDTMYYYKANSTEIDGIRVGDWKYLITGSRGKPKPMLFNLKEDLGERNNLITQHPEKAEALKKAMMEFDASIAVSE